MPTWTAQLRPFTQIARLLYYSFERHQQPNSRRPAWRSNQGTNRRIAAALPASARESVAFFSHLADRSFPFTYAKAATSLAPPCIKSVASPQLHINYANVEIKNYTGGSNPLLVSCTHSTTTSKSRTSVRSWRLRMRGIQKHLPTIAMHLLNTTVAGSPCHRHHRHPTWALSSPQTTPWAHRMKTMAFPTALTAYKVHPSYTNPIQPHNSS